MNSYDLVPYVSRPLAAAQCRVLETLAALYGMSPAPLESARVLELGCGSGENLVAQALEYPGAQFTGYDSSAVAIAAGRALIDELGLPNLELRQQDLCDLDSQAGDFDYILCHGVYSWVAPTVRARLLDVFRERLRPQGVGYLSYNVYPGWHLRGVVRELLRSQGGEHSDPQQAVGQALDILALAAETTSPDSAIGTLFREEYFDLSCAAPGYLYHEMLGAQNEPCYFRDFFARLEAAGLQYLGDAEFARNFAENLPPQARVSWQRLPLQEREQLCDYLRGASFRSSLLCGGEVPLDRQLEVTKLRRFSVSLASETRVESAPHDSELSADGGLRLRTGTLELCTGSDPLTVAAIQCLQDRQPGFVPVEELHQAALEKARCLADRDIARAAEISGPLLRFLRDAATAGALTLHLSPPRIACRVNQHPRVSPFARLQAQRGQVVINQFQQPVLLSAASLFLTWQLDGSRDPQQLTALLDQELSAGRLTLCPEEQAGDSELLVQGILAELCRNALLVA